jgi:hypothetical protein
MKLDEIQKLWEEDNVNDIDLEKETVKVIKLHSKYWNILNDEKILLRKIEKEEPELRIDLRSYYDGTISMEVLEKRNWQPFQKRILKSVVDDHIEANQDWQILRDRITIQNIKIKYLEDIIKNLNQRQFHIKNVIEFKKLMFGVV